MPSHLPPSRDYLSLGRRQRAGWVVVLGLMVAIGALNIDLYLPAFPTLERELAASPTQIQLTLSGALAGFAIGQLVIGPLSDAYGRRAPVLAGLGLFVGASLAVAAAPSIELIVALRVLQGVGVAAPAVVALAVARDLFDGVGAARLISRLLLIIGVAPLFAPSLGSAVLALTGWRGVFVALAATGVGLLALLVLRLPETLPPARRRPPGLRSTAVTYRTLLADGPTVGLMVTAGLLVSALFFYVGAAPFVLQGLYGLSATGFALAFAAVGGSFVAGSQLTGQLVSRVAPERLLVAALGGGVAVASVLVALTFAGTAGLAGFLVALCAVLFCVGMALPTSPSLVLDRQGWAAGSASALVGFAQFGIGASIAPTAGLLGLRADRAMAIGIVVALTAALAVHLAAVRPGLRRPPRREGSPPASARGAVWADDAACPAGSAGR